MKRLFTRSCLLLLSMLASLSTAAAESGHGHGGGNKAERQAQAELGASAIFDARGVLWAAHKAEGRIALSRSDDRGSTWTAPVRVTPEAEETDPGGDARPKIAIGSDGEIYITWTRPLAKPYSGEIRLARSLDGGRSFSASTVVHRDRQEITHRFDSVTVNSRGQVFVAWIDKRDLVAATATKAVSYRGAAVYYAVSDDRGATFRGDFKVADHACECCRIALSPGPNGEVTALWRHIFQPNIRDHAMATLLLTGIAEGFRRATFEDWKIDACPHHGPSLDADGNGAFHAVWFSQAPERQGVFYGKLEAGKTPAARRVGGEGAEHADLAANGNRVAIAWKEFDGNQMRLRGMISNDGGNGWREVELATTLGASDHPRVLFADGRFFAFWNTRNEPLRMTSFPSIRDFKADTLGEMRRAHAGHPMVVAFWSLHCEPCRGEIAALVELRRTSPNLPIALVSVDAPGSRAEVERYLDTFDLGGIETWQFADDFAERLRFAVDRTWRGELPRAYFYNASHEASMRSGAVDRSWMQEWVLKAGSRKESSE